jgi:aspartyl protease family protein
VRQDLKMRTVLIFLCIMAAICTFASQQLDKWNKVGQPAIMTATPAPPASASGRTVTLQSDRRGHFLVDARVDGRAVDFMVDTGASAIALRESSAAKLGIHPARRDYTAKASTANGIVAVAPSCSTASRSTASPCATSRPS